MLSWGHPFWGAPFFLFREAYLENVMKRSRKGSQLGVLRELVNNLSDRDIKIKRDIRLFEEFFENFPVPVSIWTISSEGAVVSQRGNGLICKDGKCIDTLFESFGEKESIIEAHKGALKGTSFQKLIEYKDKMFYVSIVPRRDDEDTVSGVIGLAWDVSPNNEMLKSLKRILLLSSGELEKTNDALKEIQKEAESALKASRLYNLIKSSGD